MGKDISEPGIEKENDRPRQTSVIEIPYALIQNLDKAQTRIRFLVTSTPNQLTATEGRFIGAILEYTESLNVKKTTSITLEDWLAYSKNKNRLVTKSKTGKPEPKLPEAKITVLKRLQALTKIGIFTNTEMDPSTSGGRPAKKYRFEYLHDEQFSTLPFKELKKISVGRGISRRTNVSGTIKDLRKSDNLLVKEISAVKPRSETFFTGILDRALRINSREVIEGNQIVRRMKVKKAGLTVIATAHKELATLGDQRVIRALVTIIAHMITEKIDSYHAHREKILLRRAAEHGVKIFDQDTGKYLPINPEDYATDADILLTNEQICPNRFLLETTDLAKLMGYKSPSSGSVRKLINQSLRRLYDTNFRLYVSNPDSQEAVDVMNLFGLDDTATDFRFIQDLKSQYNLDHAHWPNRSTILPPTQSFEYEADPYSDEQLKRVRLWQISIDSYLYDRLLDKETRPIYVAHREAMVESNGVAQSLYNFFSSIIGRTNRSSMNQRERVYNQPVEVLNDTLWAGRRPARFKHELVSILRDHSKRKGIEFDESLNHNEVPIFGYIFSLYRPKSTKDSRLRIRVQRNPHDPLTGDNSFVNLTLAKSIKEHKDIDLYIQQDLLDD